MAFTSTTAGSAPSDLQNSTASSTSPRQASWERMITGTKSAPHLAATCTRKVESVPPEQAIATRPLPLKNFIR